MNSDRQHVDDIASGFALLGPFGTCDRLGLKHRREGRTAFISCPWHSDKTPSCTVAIGPSGTIRVHCFSCAQTWDVLSLVAQIERLDTKSDFPKVLLRAAEFLGCWDIVAELEGTSLSEQAARPVATIPLPEPEPEKTYPPKKELSELLGSCVRVNQDREVWGWLKKRGLNPDEVAVRGLAVALPPSAALPRWTRWNGNTWIETGHRLLVECYDSKGEVRSVRAARVVDNDSPKRLPTAGHKASSLVLADAMGQEMLRAGKWPEWAGSEPRVLICEGEPDFLTWGCSQPLGSKPPHAVIGIWSGSWSEEFAAVIPQGAQVAIWTDNDTAGDGYAAKIRTSLESKCNIVRGRLSA